MHVEIVKNQPFHRRLGFAFNGIVSAFRTEASFRFQSVALVVLIVALAVLRAPAGWWAILLLNAMLVLSAELFNTALEHVVDRLHPEVDNLIRLAKDCAAGAVLVLSTSSLVLFALFLYDRHSI